MTELQADLNYMSVANVNGRRNKLYLTFNCKLAWMIEIDLPAPHNKFKLKVTTFFPVPCLFVPRHKKALIRVRNRGNFENGV